VAREEEKVMETDEERAAAMEFDALGVEAIYLPARASASDPLAQREYLGVRMAGGLGGVVYAGPGPGGEALIAEVARRMREAIEKAVAAEGGKI
jgi:hypothetical protein